MHITLNIEHLTLNCPKPALLKQFVLVWHVGPVHEQKNPPGPFGDITMQPLTETQQIRVGVTITSKKGGPAPVQNPIFSSTDVNVITVAPDDQDPTNPLKALVKANQAGAATLKFSADADMGDGVVPLEATLDFQVTGGQASVITISAGTPEEQP